MANKSMSVRVLGLAELARAFKQVSADAPIEMKTGLKGVAENIAGKIRAKFPHISGRAAGSVKSQAGTRGAAIAFGGQAAPYAPWLDFGGSVGRGRTGPNTGSVHRTFIKSGRYTYPTISASRDEISRAVEDVVVSVARHNGFEVRG